MGSLLWYSCRSVPQSTPVHPQIAHTLNASNLRRSRPLRRSVSNLLRYSCRSVPQSTPVHPQIEHTLNASNLRRSRPSRRSVSNLLRYSCRSVPQSTPGTPKTKSRACYSLRGPTIWRERSTVFTSVRAYAPGVYWASFVKAKTVRKTCFESSSALAHVAAALPGRRQ